MSKELKAFVTYMTVVICGLLSLLCIDFVILNLIGWNTTNVLTIFTVVNFLVLAAVKLAYNAYSKNKQSVEKV